MSADGCTLRADTWCPVHGTCACPPLLRQWSSHPDCPLHAPKSKHAEVRADAEGGR